jgi:DNA segregation ATPase FtsK/SpoIIIE, S-DNA-T family
LLDRLVRQGRAFGIHVLLGSQTIGGSSGLARSTIGQMAVRVALQTTEADSQLILGDNNSAARLLSRPGEAIYNDQGGLVEANSPFQIAWLPDEQRERYLVRVLERAKAEGKAIEPSAVFEGNAPADIRMNRRLSTLLEHPGKSKTGPVLAWLGDPVAIKDPTAIAIRRQSGSNALIVGQQEESALALTMSSMISLAAQLPEEACRFVILDGTAADSHLFGMLPNLAKVFPNDTKLVEYRVVPEAIAEIHAEMQHRLTNHVTDAPSIFMVIYGLQRYRALRKSEESFSFGSSDEEKKPQPDKQFAEILREGPPLGIHVITWCDTPAAVERTLERQSMRESSNLIDSPAANKLGFYRALAFSEEQGVLEKFRPYAMPDRAWLAQVAERLRRDSERQDAKTPS